MSENSKSVYTLGAEDGLIMGPLMAVTAVLTGASTYVAWVSILGILGMIAVPVLAYYRLAASHRNNPRTMTFTALWLQGIVMFFCGGLIMSAVSFVMMRWAVPGFIVHQIDVIISAYGAIDDPSAATMVDTFKKLKSSGALPSPLDVTLELLYISVFSGSILSVIYALIIRHRRPTPPPYKS